MIRGFWTGSFRGLGFMWRSDMGPGVLLGNYFWHLCNDQCFCQKTWAGTPLDVK